MFSSSSPGRRVWSDLFPVLLGRFVPILSESTGLCGYGGQWGLPFRSRAAIFTGFGQHAPLFFVLRLAVLDYFSYHLPCRRTLVPRAADGQRQAPLQSMAERYNITLCLF